MMNTPSATNYSSKGLPIPTEVLALVLEWIHPDWTCMKSMRLVSRKWLVAVAMVMEVEMSRGELEQGAWIPKSRQRYRQVLCSLRLMSEAFLDS